MLAKRAGEGSDLVSAYNERLRDLIPNRAENNRYNEANRLYDKYRMRISNEKNKSVAVLEKHLKDAEMERNELGLSPFPFPSKPRAGTNYIIYLNFNEFSYQTVDGPHWVGPDKTIWFKDSEGVKWAMGLDRQAFKAKNAWFLDPPLYNFP